MSKIADCPDCGAHNCVGDSTDLNYCMWCGHSFKKDRELPQKQVENLIIDAKSGQIKLF